MKTLVILLSSMNIFGQSSPILVDKISTENMFTRLEQKVNINKLTLNRISINTRYLFEGV